MDVTATASSQAPSQVTALLRSAEPKSLPGKQLGAEDFLRLLTVQLANQNPLEPMGDTEFIAQMSNFSSLEQMRQLNTTLGQFSSEQRLIGAQNYLGKSITYTTPSGQTGNMTVDAVTLEGDKVLLHQGDLSTPVERVLGSFLRPEPVTPIHQPTA